MKGFFTMKFRRTISSILATTFMAVSLPLSCTTINSNASLINDTSAGVAWTPEDFNPNITSSYCPVAGLYKKGESRVLITPDGKVYLKDFSFSSMRTPVSCQTEVMKVDYSQYHVYTDFIQTEIYEPGVNYEIYLNETGYRNIKGIAPSDQDLVKEYLDVGTRIYVKQDYIDAPCYFTEQPDPNVGKAGASLDAYEKIADYSHTNYKKLWFGDCDTTYTDTPAVNAIDVVSLQRYLVERKKDFHYYIQKLKFWEVEKPPIYSVCEYNADFDLDGKITVADLATLQNVVVAKKTSLNAFHDEFGFYPY